MLHIAGIARFFQVMLWIGLSAIYGLMMFVWWLGWRRVRSFEATPTTHSSTCVSVIVPARNESSRIEACLNSLLAQRYPNDRMEVIVVDDHSEDHTAVLVQKMAEQHPCVQLLSRSGNDPAGKKAALTAGIHHAKGDLIVTTDADCEMPQEWLQHIEAVFNQYLSVQMVTAPVIIHRETNLLQRFQALDLMGMMGITGAGAYTGRLYMANGANLAFRRTAFETVGGYAGNEQIASGDDMFLVQKIVRHFPGGVFFLKQTQATVRTLAPADWRTFVQQRIRWGSKNAAMPGLGVRLPLLAVFIFCWSIIICGVLAALQAPNTLQAFGVQLAVKAFFDFLLLREMAVFFKKRTLLRWFVPAFVLHTFYIALIGLASLFLKSYQWKGRHFR